MPASAHPMTPYGVKDLAYLRTMKCAGPPEGGEYYPAHFCYTNLCYTKIKRAVYI